ncbi:MAG TPA: sugar phosphate isomerase/epimerase family protein [Geopsychrobacteraceae bacterium]|nr:sugar phosphate isomerase/epimerase family protein [Geopsychrobacteraceae bacterium]
MHKLLHIHLPLRLLKKRLMWLIKHHLQPEIAFQGNELDKVDHQFLHRVGEQLAKNQLQVTIHAPFFDLNPGAIDFAIESITRQRFNQTLDVAESLQAKLIVFHPGYDRWRYDRQPDLWHDQSLAFWPPLIERAEKITCLMCLENIFEVVPETLAKLLDELNSPWLGHCFDVGHWNLFSETPLQYWFERLGHHTRHIHLHDNRGTADEHLAIGQGQIDFSSLFNHISALESSPSMTLEAHTSRDLKKSLTAVLPFLDKLST